MKPRLLLASFHLIKARYSTAFLRNFSAPSGFCAAAGRVGTALAFSLAALAAGAQVLAVSSAAAPLPQNFNLEGKITRLAPGKITVNTEENIIFHVAYSDKTQFKRADGSAASAQDLRVGQQIKVSGDLDESGEIVAARIEIQPSTSEKKSSSVSGRPAPLSWNCGTGVPGWLMASARSQL